MFASKSFCSWNAKGEVVSNNGPFKLWHILSGSGSRNHDGSDSNDCSAINVSPVAPRARHGSDGFFQDAAPPSRVPQSTEHIKWSQTEEASPWPVGKAYHRKKKKNSVLVKIIGKRSKNKHMKEMTDFRMQCQGPFCLGTVENGRPDLEFPVCTYPDWNFQMPVYHTLTSYFYC